MRPHFRLTVWLAGAAALGLLSTLPTPALAADERIRIAVVDFDTEAIRGSWHYGWSWTNLERAAADNLAAELVKSGKFRVIERQQLDKVVAEQNLGDQGRVDASTAAKLGKVLGVQIVVIGSVTEFGVDETGGRVPQIGAFKGLKGIGGTLVTGKSALTARVVDTTTAEILGAYEGSGSKKFGKGEFAGGSFGKSFDTGLASKVLATAVDQLAGQIAAGAGAIAPSTSRGGLDGKVAKVAGSTLYLNLGASSGVKVGDRFEIRSMGESIVDPDTGESLGGSEESIGIAEVTKVVNERLCEAKVVEGSGFAVGNRALMK